jgi:hypothetical protein
MNQEIIDVFIEHHGVKGMRWGVRRSQKKMAKKDKKWQKNIYSVHGAIAVHNATAAIVNSKIDDLNNRHPDAHLFDSPNSKETKAYISEYEKMVEKATHDAVQSVHGVSPSGKLRARLDTSNPEQWSVKVDSVEAKHADGTLPSLTFDVDQDPDGYVGDMHFVKEDLQQSAVIEEFIEHHGVKGMRWGVRRARGSRVSKAKARTKYGKSPSRLTNAELERRINRMQTEKRYNELNKRDVSNGERIASEILTNAGKKVATTVLAAAGMYAVKVALSKKLGPEIGDALTKKIK